MATTFAPASPSTELKENSLVYGLMISVSVNGEQVASDAYDIQAENDTLASVLSEQTSPMTQRCRQTCPPKTMPCSASKRSFQPDSDLPPRIGLAVASSYCLAAAPANLPISLTNVETFLLAIASSTDRAEPSSRAAMFAMVSRTLNTETC